MANSTISMVTSIAMIILFTIAILAFSIGFANDNSAAVRIDDDSDINSLYDDTSGSTSSFRSETEDSYKSIANTTIEAGSDVIKSPAVFTLTWTNLFATFGTILNVIFVVVFGGNATFAIFTTSLIAIIGFMFTLYIIKAWRGSP